MLVKPTPFVPGSVADWTGAYLGIHAGLARHNALFKDTDYFFDGCSPIDGQRTGGIAGGLLGYNWQQGSFVYGLESDWRWVGAKARGFILDFSDNADLSISYDVN